MSVTQISAHTFEIGGMGVVLPQPVVDATAPVMQSVTAPVAVSIVAAPAVATPPPALTAEVKPLTAKQMLAQMKARLKVVERELVAKTELERERDQLRRLIRAAKNETDNVRRLRSAV